MESIAFFDNFSSRLSSCLKNNNILTREDLLKLTEKQVRKLNGLGRSLWYELLGWMTENSLSFYINNQEDIFNSLDRRTKNCLKNAEIRTLNDLLNCTEEDLRHIRNIGSSSLEEIKTVLASHGLKLESVYINSEEAFFNSFGCRTKNCLRNANIRTINDLLNYTEIRLLKIRNFGLSSLEEIKTVLASHELKLKSVDSDNDYNFTSCTYFWLAEAGINTLDELLGKNDDFFLALIENHPNHFGKGCYKEIKEFLAKNNLSLKE